jgi:hypothetical protein
MRAFEFKDGKSKGKGGRESLWHGDPLGED